MALVAVAFMVLGLVGLWLLVTGLRPRPIDDHPVCAACGYDLIGMTAALPERCPECGGSLHAEGSRSAGVRTGNRKHRARRAWTGAAVCALWLLIVAPVAVSFVAGGKLVKYEPTWFLMLQADWRSDRGVGAVVDELLSRHASTRSLAADQQRRLARRALAIQHLSSHASRAPDAWTHHWQAVLEDPTLLSLLSKPEQAQALTAGVHAWMLARKVIIRGAVLPVAVRMNFDPRFLGAAGRSTGVNSISVRLRDAAGAEVFATSQPMHFRGNVYIMEGDAGWGGGEYRAQPDLPPGVYTLEAECELQLIDTSTAAVSAAVPVHHTQRVEVVPVGSSAVGTVEAPELIDAVRNNLRISLSTSAYGGGKTWVGVGVSDIGHTMDSTGAELQRRGISCVYQLHLRPQSGDGPEWDLGHMALSFKDDHWSILLGGNAINGALPGGKYRLRLAPDWDHAAKSVEHERILGGEIELRDIDVKGD